MFKKLLRTISVIILMMSVSSCSTLESSFTVDKFTFSPPDGISYTETTKTITKVKPDIAEIMPLKTELVIVSDVTIIKTDGAYSLISTSKSSSQFMNDEPMKNPVLEAMVGSEINVLLTDIGAVKSVTGFEKVIDKALKAVPEEQIEAAKEQLTADVFLENFKTSWSERVGSSIGKTIKKGETWSYDAITSVPGKGSIKMVITYVITKKVKCGKNSKCVVLNYSYDLDSEGLDEAFNDMSIKGSGVRVLDPLTMVIYSDNSGYIMSMTTDFMGQSIKMINDMTTNYSIEVH